MAEYIEREAAICIADYAAAEHPYDKNPGKPETFSDYNQGWHDACDYIRERLENAGKADVAEVRHGRWLDVLYLMNTSAPTAKNGRAALSRRGRMYEYRPDVFQ